MFSFDGLINDGALLTRTDYPSAMTTQRSGSMLEEWPYAYVVNSDKAVNNCAFCLKRSETPLQRCSRCRQAHFCNESCQRAAWSEHRDECACLVGVSPRVPTALARLMARIIFKRHDEARSDPALTVWNNRRFEDLMNHKEEIGADPERSEHFVALCHVLRDYIGVDRLPRTAELMDIFGKCVINGISISDDDLNAVGIGLYVGLSALNHSCDPDAFVLFDGPKALIRPLKSGLDGRPFDQITISYCDLLSTTKERQLQLQQQYYFLCNCSICGNKRRDSAMRSLRCVDCSGEAVVDDSDGSKQSAKCWQCGKMALDVDDAISLMQQIQWRLGDLETSEDLGAALTEGGRLADSAARLLSDVNIFAARLSDCLTELNLKAARPTQAATHCERALAAYIRFYPAAHPAVSLQLAKAGKLLSCVSLPDAARRLEQAESSLTASHGAHHRLTEACRVLATELREERRVTLSRSRLLELSD